jgi:hypothetical protein
MGAAASMPTSQTFTPGAQMSPEEIIDSINHDLCRAIDEARANGTLVQEPEK